MSIKVVLWDIDGTLLDFNKPEREAVKKCFALFGLGECSDEMVAWYSMINKVWWDKLEKGLNTKQEILEGRFREFLEHFGLDGSLAPAFNESYQNCLGDVVDPNPNGLETMKELFGKVVQGVATNGTVKTQNSKMKTSGIDRLVQKVYISDLIGFEKPNMGFFDFVLKDLSEFSKNEIMIVGDSLTSDMRGGNNAGIVCCWYNPERKPLNGDLKIDYEITDLAQVKEIVNELA